MNDQMGDAVNEEVFDSDGIVIDAADQSARVILIEVGHREALQCRKEVDLHLSDDLGRHRGDRSALNDLNRERNDCKSDDEPHDEKYVLQLVQIARNLFACFIKARLTDNLVVEKLTADDRGKERNNRGQHETNEHGSELEFEVLEIAEHSENDVFALMTMRTNALLLVFIYRSALGTLGLKLFKKRIVVLDGIAAAHTLPDLQEGKELTLASVGATADDDRGQFELGFGCDTARICSLGDLMRQKAAGCGVVINVRTSQAAQLEGFERLLFFSVAIEFLSVAVNDQPGLAELIVLIKIKEERGSQLVFGKSLGSKGI